MTATTEELTVTDTIMIGWGQYARPVTPVTLEGTTLYRTADGTLYRSCGRCDGKGKIASYGHVYGGECFECSHSGLRRAYADEATAIKSIRKAARAAERREAKRAAAYQAEIDARCTPEAIDAAHDAALRVQAQLEAKAARVTASRHVGTEGERVTITGEVRVAMDVDATDFRTGRPTSKRFVIVAGTGEDEGITLKLTGTADALYQVEKGQAVTMTASVKAHTTGRDGEAVTTAIRPKLG